MIITLQTKQELFYVIVATMSDKEPYAEDLEAQEVARRRHRPSSHTRSHAKPVKGGQRDRVSHRPARQAPSETDRNAVRAEQEAMNETMRNLFGADTNPTQLNVDGIDKRSDGQKSATDSIREILDTFIDNIDAFKGNNGMSRTEKLKKFNEFITTPEGQEFLKTKSPPDKDGRSTDVPGYIEKMRDAADSIPRNPNGFVLGSGVRGQPVAPQPDPANKDGSAPVAPAPPVRDVDVDPDAPAATAPTARRPAGAGRDVDVDPDAPRPAAATPPARRPAEVGATDKDVDPDAARPTRAPAATPGR
ncbi:MAG: hypothetical protein K2Q32_04240 [Alphaproteobacteria bacterium]|nr:hypothetical protein [Alphaproteobacteria bacterium]